jgi:pyrimidine-nucleoside phosphorylase
MKTKSQAQKLAQTLVRVAKKMGLPCRAILTDMNQPLGYAVGNAIEVRESIEVLKNEKNSDLSSVDLKELTIHLCAHMLCLGKVVKNFAEGRKLAQSKLADGSAWKVFVDLVKLQGGNTDHIHDVETGLLVAPKQITWKAKKRGYIGKMDTEAIGRILIELGGGRKKASDAVDPSVGFIFHKKLGNRVQQGDPLVTVYAKNETLLDDLEALFHDALEITSTRKPVPKLIFEQYL